MDFQKILIDYHEKFGIGIGIPWNGFGSDEKAKEYYDELVKCIETDIPFSDEARARFFPDMSDASNTKVY